jgi:hypothetical protein
MTKAEARALLRCRKAVEKALSQCEEKLSGDQLTFAQNYWMAHIHSSIASFGHGCAGRVMATAEEELQK